jgi:hypothetical protein
MSAFKIGAFPAVASYFEHNARRQMPAPVEPAHQVPPVDDPLATTIRAAIDGQKSGFVVEEGELHLWMLDQFHPRTRCAV